MKTLILLLLVSSLYAQTKDAAARTTPSINGLTITTSTGTLTIPNGVVLTGPAASGTAATLGNTNALTGRQDATGAASTAPMKTGTSLPGTCVVGDQYFKSDATAGQNIYECAATNTWTQQLNSGSGGGATIPSVTNIIKGNGSGNGADTKVAITSPTTAATINFAADNQTTTLPNGTLAAYDFNNITTILHDLIFTDATYDIGKSGATRPRDFFASRNGAFGGTLNATGHVTFEGVTSTGATGSGLMVFGSSPTIITPTIVSFTNATHNHQAAAGGGTLAEAALALTNVTTNDATTSAHGFAPKGTTGTTQFWRQDWTLATPGGAGTVTVVGAGALTSTALVTGGGTTTLQTPSATATMDASGNVSTPGTVTTGVGSGLAGAYDMGAGTAHTATGVGFQAPAAITTPFMMTLPVLPATGFLLNTGTTDPGVLSFVAATGAGSVVRATSPTLVTPALGTPTALVLTSATGLPTAGLLSNAVTSAKLAVVNTYRVCSMVIGADNGAALGTTDIAPQGRQCFIPSAVHIVEIDVAADGGTPAVVVAKNHAGSLTDLSASLATASSGGLACANVAGSGTGIDGATTCGVAITGTTAAQGDWFETHTSASASTAKRMSISITYTVD